MLDIRQILDNMKIDHNGIYAAVSEALETVSTMELVKYYMYNMKLELSLRSYIEDQIIANEINKRIYEREV